MLICWIINSILKFLLILYDSLLLHLIHVAYRNYRSRFRLVTDDGNISKSRRIRSKLFKKFREFWYFCQILRIFYQTTLFIIVMQPAHCAQSGNVKDCSHLCFLSSLCAFLPYTFIVYFNFLPCTLAC